MSHLRGRSSRATGEENEGKRRVQEEVESIEEVETSGKVEEEVEALRRQQGWKSQEGQSQVKEEGQD